MFPFVVKDETWDVIQVPSDDVRLIDRTGSNRLATTDPRARAVYVSIDIMPPLLDKVMLHEVAHAITVSYGLTDYLKSIVPYNIQVAVEEWAVGLVENFGMEAVIAASEALGRPLCIRNNCAMVQ